MGMFREFGNHEDSDTALKTFERTVRRLFLDVHTDVFDVRVGEDAPAMAYVALPLCQGLGAVVERYRMEHMMD
eukprot:5933010-Lingulodinium_polyedra.AAC.1